MSNETDLLVEEIWLPAKDYERFYEVSNLGNVRSIPREVKPNYGGVHIVSSRVLKQMNQHGYRKVTLSLGGRYKNIAVHRLIATTFLRNPENKRCVNHKNLIRHDNRVDNLEWATNKENSEHAVANGRFLKREAHKQAKLFSDDVEKIREIYNRGLLSSHRLAKAYNVSQYAIMCVVKNKTWN